jgi:hypothetical protein
MYVRSNRQSVFARRHKKRVTLHIHRYKNTSLFSDCLTLKRGTPCSSEASETLTSRRGVTYQNISLQPQGLVKYSDDILQ